MPGPGSSALCMLVALSAAMLVKSQYVDYGNDYAVASEWNTNINRFGGFGLRSGDYGDDDDSDNSDNSDNSDGSNDSNSNDDGSKANNSSDSDLPLKFAGGTQTQSHSGTVSQHSHFILVILGRGSRDKAISPFLRAAMQRKKITTYPCKQV